MKRFLWTVVASIILILSFVAYPLSYASSECKSDVQAVTSTAQAGKPIPIIMYHSVLKSVSNRYTVSPSQVEQDIQYLINHNYTFITAKELYLYQQGKFVLPTNPIIISFDDGFYNFYYYVFPLLKKYHAKAVLSVVGCLLDEWSGKTNNVNYGYVAYSNVKEMHDSKLVEIANHTYAMHGKKRRGVAKRKSETTEQFASTLSADLNKVQKSLALHGVPAPLTFTYPYGSYDEYARRIVKDIGFKVAFTCNEGCNYVTATSSLMLLKRYIRTPDRSVRQILSKK